MSAGSTADYLADLWVVQMAENLAVCSAAVLAAKSAGQLAGYWDVSWAASTADLLAVRWAAMRAADSAEQSVAQWAGEKAAQSAVPLDLWALKKAVKSADEWAAAMVESLAVCWVDATAARTAGM
jgi:hypothetical protein